MPCRTLERHHQPPDRRLAATGLAHEAERLPPADGQRDVRDGLDRADRALQHDPGGDVVQLLDLVELEHDLAGAVSLPARPAGPGSSSTSRRAPAAPAPRQLMAGSPPPRPAPPASPSAAALGYGGLRRRYVLVASPLERQSFGTSRRDGVKAGEHVVSRCRPP